MPMTRLEYELVVSDLAGEHHLCQVDVTPETAPPLAPVIACCQVASARIHINREAFYVCAAHLVNIHETVGKLPPRSLISDPRWK
jgi:hypothetical protein